MILELEDCLYKSRREGRSKRVGHQLRINTLPPSKEEHISICENVRSGIYGQQRPTQSGLGLCVRLQKPLEYSDSLGVSKGSYQMMQIRRLTWIFTVSKCLENAFSHDTAHK